MLSLVDLVTTQFCVDAVIHLAQKVSSALQRTCANLVESNIDSLKRVQIHLEPCLASK